MRKGSSLTTTECYAAEVKTKAYDLYLNSDTDLDDMACILEVPRHVLLEWSLKGHWADRKIELETEAFKESELKYRRFLMENKLPTVERHLKVAKQIEEEIAKALDHATASGGVLDSMTLRRLSEALSSVTSVSSRAAGVTDRGLQMDEKLEDAKKALKQPLVVIGVGPQLPQQGNQDVAGAPGVKVYETTVEPQEQR